MAFTPMVRIPLGRGWLSLDMPDDPTSFDVLYLDATSGMHRYVHEIHVPVYLRNAIGELVADDHGEDISLGKGMLVPYNRGIRLVDPKEPRRSTLKLFVVRRISNLVSLYFSTNRIA